ncbi:putative monovalent cation/H+ antiporter subunit F [Jannaschia seosinensis]|uniref:Putative monovalent cation/H+ antiporter subunit F n=1 Tax=Jannaschia seosinensis TaxID=313367 RepID=A0A0M7B511_9RHOB|nr:hypothetical protein [Jannaschia seosinensis]CUH22917.1 putative monovalent cation/H+ antiporter subunit F [Jannaschia seosinensis]
MTGSLTNAKPILATAVQVALSLVLLDVILAVFRLIKVPSPPDRVVALGTMTALVVGFCGLFMLDTGSQPSSPWPWFLR